MSIIGDKINRLKNAGLLFYLDDFGTGYSNMDRILKFPFDLIKFDKLFMDSLYGTDKGGYISKTHDEQDYLYLFRC